MKLEKMLHAWMQVLGTAGICVVYLDDESSAEWAGNALAQEYINEHLSLQQQTHLREWLNANAETEGSNVWTWKKNEGTLDVVLDVLTKREKQVFEELRNGASNYEIANTLNISIRTVEKHVENMLKKLKIHRRDQISSML